MYVYVYECITLYMYVYACIHVFMHVSVCISDCGPLSRVSQARAGISGAGLKMAMLHTSLCHHLIPKISLPQAAIGIVTRPKRQVGAWRTVCAAAFGVSGHRFIGAYQGLDSIAEPAHVSARKSWTLQGGPCLDSSQPTASAPPSHHDAHAAIPAQ